MSEKEKQNMIESVNKTPLQSKKFIASMIWNIAWLCLIGLGILKGVEGSVIESMVWACATSCGLYLGGQSFVDSVVRYGVMKLGASTKEQE